MNMFATAKSLPGKTAKGKKVEREVVETEGLHVLAALRAVEANLKGQIAIAEAGVKSIMGEHFVEVGLQSGRKPDNYEGIELGSVASLQLRARSSASALSEDECVILDEHNIPYREEISRDETFVVNPAYAADMTMLGKVSEALESLGLPADFFMKQEKVSKHITTDKSMDAVFALKGEDAKSTATALLPLVSTLAIRATFAENANPFAVVEAAVGSPEDTDA